MVNATKDGLNYVVGAMSGTSLDGLDLILCSFRNISGKWEYHILKTDTVSYSPEWKYRLSSACKLDALSFLTLHNEYGTFIGKKVSAFLGSADVKPGLVSSHGHTVFHQPKEHLTFQIGSGAAIAASSGITTISDFRTLDVALGGEGAPLVPAGDELLFNEYDYCLNIGGFANISYKEGDMRLACDLCPANIVSNAVAQRIGKEFDYKGEIGALGVLRTKVVDALNELPYYSQHAPKSLGREWVEDCFMKVLNRFRLNSADLLRCYYEHVSVQISNWINCLKKGTVLLTGGGTYNDFLVSLIREKCQSRLVIPGEDTIEYKEALIFALLGLLRYRDEINCFASVTGASRDSSLGTVWEV